MNTQSPKWLLTCVRRIVNEICMNILQSLYAIAIWYRAVIHSLVGPIMLCHLQSNGSLSNGSLHFLNFRPVPYTHTSDMCYIWGNSTSMLGSVHSAYVDCFQTQSPQFHDYTVCKNILCAFTLMKVYCMLYSLMFSFLQYLQGSYQ
jgi:ABC-type amino acid transport system permease subunit